MIDHVAAFFRKDQEELRYRAYVTDALKAIAENTMHYIIPGVSDVVTYGSYIPIRWYGGNEHQKEEPKTGDEIAAEIIRRAGLTLKGGNE